MSCCETGRRPPGKVTRMTAREPVPRLGRGLAFLLGETRPDHHAVQADLHLIEVAALEPNPFQPRGPIDTASLAELTDSIRSQGVLQPLLVRPHGDQPGQFQIVAGERRWRAATLAGLTEIPCLVRKLTNAQTSAAALVENLQRDDLNAMEEAEGFRRLQSEFGMTQDNLATAIGKSRSHVANTVRLLNLPDKVQHEVRSGALSAGHARALLGHPDPARAALSVIARGLNVRQTEAMAAAVQQRPSRPVHDDPDSKALERRLTERLGLVVTLSTRGAGGRLSIQYTDLDQLDGLLTLLGG